MTAGEIYQMPCGCRPGYFLCLEAEQLWREVGNAYERAKVTGNYEPYDQARIAYSQHYAVVGREQPR